MSVAYDLASSAAFAATAGAKTFLLAIAPVGHGLELVALGVSADGVTSSAVPLVLDIVVSTQAGAGTSGANPTITQARGRSSGGSAPTGGGNYTAEPTVLTVLRTLFIPQFMGVYERDFPLGRGLQCDSSGGGTLGFKAIGLRVNVSAAVNLRGYIEVEAVG